MAGNFAESLRQVGYEHEGKNFVIDKGTPEPIYGAYLESLNQYIQTIKLGWTTWSLFQDEELQKKLTIAKKYDKPVCLGGTLFEISYRQGLYTDLIDYLQDMNINTIEIASGFSVDFEELPPAIALAKKNGLKVMVEVGYKDQQKDEAMTISERVHHIQVAKDCGADYVILEARELGAGYSVYTQDTDRNIRLLDSILNIVPLETLVFEAPSRNNQIQLVQTLGPNVNMANLPFDEIPRVETIRRGLHADTYATIQNLKKRGL